MIKFILETHITKADSHGNKCAIAKITSVTGSSICLDVDFVGTANNLRNLIMRKADDLGGTVYEVEKQTTKRAFSETMRIWGKEGRAIDHKLNNYSEFLQEIAMMGYNE